MFIAWRPTIMGTPGTGGWSKVHDETEWGRTLCGTPMPPRMHDWFFTHPKSPALDPCERCARIRQGLAAQHDAPIPAPVFISWRDKGEEVWSAKHRLGASDRLTLCGLEVPATPFEKSTLPPSITITECAECQAAAGGILKRSSVPPPGPTPSFYPKPPGNIHPVWPTPEQRRGERIDLTARHVLAAFALGAKATDPADLFAGAAYDFAEALEVEREKRHA